MRVAVCLYGEPRFFNTYTYKSIKKYIDMYDADVFFHAWDNETYNAAPWYGPDAIVKEGRKDIEEELVRLYQPKKYELQKGGPMPPDPSRIPPQHAHPHAHVWNFSRSMFYSIKRSVEMKKEYEAQHGFTYDFVIRTRFDICIRNIPRLKDLDSGVFYVANFQKCADFYTITDQFSIAASHLTDWSARTYDNYYQIAAKIPLGFESMYGYNIKCLHDVPICQDSRIRTKLVRDWSETDPNPESWYKLEV